MNEPAPRIGLEPVERILVMENHDEAYHVWRTAGVKERVLIHVDAHHDMWWLPDKDLLNIANFISLALQENLLREVVWVVPDRSWETAKNRRPILRHLRRIRKRYPGTHGSPQVGSSQIAAAVLGKTLRICPLSFLPRMEEEVLLDIDTDFLVIPRVSYGEPDRQGAIPWCWPEGLLDRLHACNIRAELVTVAYSVQGGYTPLKWKYLGDELALRLRQPMKDGPAVRAMGLMREAAEAARHGNTGAGERKYHEAMELSPASPAAYYHLAQLYLDMGRVSEAQKLFRQVLTLDSSYRTPYNSKGIRYLKQGRLKQAEREHRRTLTLDPEDPYACLGLGKIAIRRKQWKQAETLLRNSLTLDPWLPDTYRALGEVLARQRRTGEAIAAYTRSLKLVLAGHESLEKPITTMRDDGPQDPKHFRSHFELARLHQLEGNTFEAIQGYRMSLAGGYESFTGRIRLAYLYLKQRQWQKAALEAWRAVIRVPSQVIKTARESLRHARGAIKTRLLAGAS